MACFTVPVVEAVITTIAEKALENYEKKTGTSGSIKISEKLGSLNKMLWGGSALLAFEHLWHGEITPWFPFLTAANSPESTMAMLHEMATSGVAMAVLVTSVWAGMVIIGTALQKRSSAENTSGGTDQ